MDNFEYIVWDRSRMGAYDLGAFIKQWAKFDSKGKLVLSCLRSASLQHSNITLCMCVCVCVPCRGKLKPEKLFELLRKLDPPVGWGRLCPRMTAYKVS